MTRQRTATLELPTKTDSGSVLASRERGRRKLLLGLSGVGVFLLILELLPLTDLVDERFLPRFSQMALSLGEWLQTRVFWTALLDTIVTWSMGLGIAVLAGIVLGLGIGSVGSLRAITASTIEFLRPIPSVALIPLAIFLFGTGMESTLLIVIYASFWQILMQVLYGVQEVDPIARDTASSYRFRVATKWTQLVWPTTFPYAVTGFRLAASVALIVTITGELIIGTPGLGQLIVAAQQAGAVSSMYALVIVTGVLGIVVNMFARLIEQRVLHWHPSVRRETSS